MDALEDAGMGWAGSSRTPEEAEQIQFYTLTGKDHQITIAHIGATMLTNGIAIPAEAPYSWNVAGELGAPVEQLVLDRAERARELGADLVVASMHWGTEYVSEPTTEQEEVATQLAASGLVDVVFGNHSHVPQPARKLPGGPRGDGMWTVYSMGNLISGQTPQVLDARLLTGILTTATITASTDEVTGETAAAVTNFEWTAVTQDRAGGEKLYPLAELLNATGSVPEDGLQLSAAELQHRADLTYPVMAVGDAAERIAAPQRPADSAGTTLTMERR